VIAAFQGHLADSPAKLAEWLTVWQLILRDLQRIVMYAQLDYSGDTGNQEAVARVGRANTLSSQVQAASAFAEPELMSIGFAKLYQWMASEPSLAIYRFYVERLEHSQAHVRSAEVEELLGQVADALQTASNTHGILANADLRIEPAHSADGSRQVEIVQGNIAALLSDPDRSILRTAWEHYADAHLAY
jgi:oligoendopeptidase F